jgi:opacity protein-like surface antigen
VLSDSGKEVSRTEWCLLRSVPKGFALQTDRRITMQKHLWPLAALPLTLATPALAYDVQFDQHTDWAYTDSSSPNSLHYRPWHFQVDLGPVFPQQGASANFDGGWNAGGGVTWYPSRYLPFGIRADGSYTKLGARQPLLDQAATQAGTTVDRGTIERWGGDLDGEIDVPLGTVARFYLLAGVGWYKTQSTFWQSQESPALLCTWWGCMQGFVHSSTLVSSTTDQWQFARNAGVGFEFSLGPGASFFMDARYLRLGSSQAKQDFIPVRFGVRF